MKIKLNIRKILILTTIAGFSFGCSDYFSSNPDDILLEEDYPGSITELYSGYMGIAAKVQEIADKAFYLEGLRSDFLEPTENADKDLIDLYRYEETPDNEFANPAGYYDVILNANDYIEHVDLFVKDNPTAIDDETFDALVGGAIRYKVWAYMMLAKLYGEAVWIDDPFEEYKDLSEYPVYGFEEVMQECVEIMENGISIGEREVNGMGVIRWSNVLFPGIPDSPANLQWNRVCPDPEPILAELYLFTGNYSQVVDNCLSIIRKGGEEASFQLNKSEWGGEWIDFFREFVRKEAIFMFTYDYNRQQTNNLVNYFSNLSPNQYLFRPTEVSMERFQNQTRGDGLEGDESRGMGKTFDQQNGQWVVNKFISAHQTEDMVFRNDVIINLYRAADVHLWLIEALGQLGRFEEALTLLNGGIETYFNASEGVFLPPFEGYPTTLYRTSSSSEGANQGVRGRALLGAVGEEILQEPSENIEEDKRLLDSLLVEETCMESAGEAKSFFTMMRVAKRWNDPAVLADRVSAKYPDGLKGTIREKLMNPQNWYIDYNLSLEE